MELFTCSYSAWRPSFGAAVVASLTTPRWMPEAAATWPRCWEITPRWAYFHEPDPEVWAQHYTDQLDRYGARRIVRRLAEIARDGYGEPQDRLVILCWEHDVADCHRDLWRCWWLTQVGEDIAELVPEPTGRR